MYVPLIIPYNGFTKSLEHFLTPEYQSKRIRLVDNKSFVSIELDTTIGTIFLDNLNRIRKITIYTETCFKFKKCFNKTDLDKIKQLLKEHRKRYR
jgi:hypothetical protein